MRSVFHPLRAGRTADVIIIGAGSAGAVLAARLSQDPRRQVLLVEAGRDTPPGRVPADVSDTFPRSYSNPRYMWPGVRAAALPGGPARGYAQARIMGGGSSVMGMWALRGLAADYERWRDSGAVGWGWGHVRPFFERLEHDRLHAADGRMPGPVPIRRIGEEDWPAHVRAAQRAAAALGYASQPDINGTDQDGFFPIPLSQHDGARVSSASAYLTADARRRDNLRIVTGSEVMRVVFDGRRVTGILALREGDTDYYEAPEVIVCAGAIHSPALLLRSGIGAAAELEALGLPVVADLPGVGRNLRNHVGVNVGLTLPPPQGRSAALRNYGVACLRASSGTGPDSAGDLLLGFIGRASMRRVGAQVGVIGVFLYDPLAVGAVVLERAGWRLRPKVTFDLLSHPRDLHRLGQGLRLALRILASPECAGTWQEAFLLPPAAPLHRINRSGVVGALQGLAAAAAFGAGGSARRAALAAVVGRDAFLDPALASALPEPQLEALARAAASPLYHVAGTCAMGQPGHGATVVDPHCRVQGVEGLRVVDASIMPTLPRANTNLPTIMLAERAAQRMLDERR